MSPAGIPAFYAADSVDLAIAETIDLDSDVKVVSVARFKPRIAAENCPSQVIAEFIRLILGESNAQDPTSTSG